MTLEEFETLYEDSELDTAYAMFIMTHADPSERMICNGDHLVEAMEDEFLFEEFKESLVDA